VREKPDMLLTLRTAHSFANNSHSSGISLHFLCQCLAAALALPERVWSIESIHWFIALKCDSAHILENMSPQRTGFNSRPRKISAYVVFQQIFMLQMGTRWQCFGVQSLQIRRRIFLHLISDLRMSTTIAWS
jgi:hypothetical protein